MDTQFNPYRRHIATAICVVIGGLIAGALDILYAIAYFGWRGVPAERILQSVASGVLGRAAYAGGWPTAALGLALHLFITVIAAAVFLVAARRLAWLARHWLVAGALYGLTIYVVMNFVVVPLSAFPQRSPAAPTPLATLLSGLLVHACFVGVPIAFAARSALAARR